FLSPAPVGRSDPQPFEVPRVCHGRGTKRESKPMARKKKSTIVGAVADAVTTAIDALAHPATTVTQARDAIIGATRKAATIATRRATTARRKVARKNAAVKRSVKKAAAKAKRKVAAKKG